MTNFVPIKVYNFWMEVVVHLTITTGILIPLLSISVLS